MSLTTETINKLFINATRQKYTFPFRGNATVQDLWDLTIQQLETIYADLHDQLEKKAKKSIFEESSPKDVVLEEKIQIVEFIAKTLKQEKDARANARLLAAEEQQLLAEIAERDNAALKSLPKEELEAKLQAIREKKSQI